MSNPVVINPSEVIAISERPDRSACPRCHGKAAIEDCMVCTKVVAHRLDRDE